MSFRQIFVILGSLTHYLGITHPLALLSIMFLFIATQLGSLLSSRQSPASLPTFNEPFIYHAGKVWHQFGVFYPTSRRGAIPSSFNVISRREVTDGDLRSDYQMTMTAVTQELQYLNSSV